MTRHRRAGSRGGPVAEPEGPHGLRPGQAGPPPREASHRVGGEHVEKFFAVRYVAAQYALSPAPERERHTRLRRFRTEAQAAAFVRECWRAGAWRVLELVEVRREGGVWVPLRLF